MPIYKVLEQIKSDYTQLIASLKADWCYKNLQNESSTTVNENESETKVKFLFNNPKLTDLLSARLNETKSLNLELNDLDCLITYLNKRKAKLVATLVSQDSFNSQNQTNPTQIQAQAQAQTQPQVPSLLSTNILPTYQLMAQSAQPTSLMSLFTQGAIPVQTIAPPPPPPLPLPPPPPPPPLPATPQQLPSLLSTISTPSLMSVQMSNFLTNSSNFNNNNNNNNHNVYFSNRF